jgi:3-hydroxybutyrate dehydrogenase
LKSQTITITITIGKVALVTGSTSGIGAAIAKSLAKAGANVVLHGLLSSEAEKIALQKQFEAEHGAKVRIPFAVARSGYAVPYPASRMIQVVISTHNVARTSEVMELVQFAQKSFGQVDILVNAFRDCGT